jgi:hypothetical protein
MLLNVRLLFTDYSYTVKIAKYLHLAEMNELRQFDTAMFCRLRHFNYRES